MKELTKKQKKELEILSAEIEAEAIQMKMDYEENPSESSGSVTIVHEDSPALDVDDSGEIIFEKNKWKRVIKK